MDEWEFDVHDTLMDGFQEDQLLLAGIAGVPDAVYWKLREIKRNPRMAGTVCAIGGDVVYLAKTGRYPSGVPPLLIAYLLDERRRIIRPFLLCEADEDVQERVRWALRRRDGGH